MDPVPVSYVDSYANIFPQDGEYDVYIRSSFKTFSNNIEDSESNSESDSDSEIDSDSESDSEKGLGKNAKTIDKRLILSFTSQLSFGEDKSSKAKYKYTYMGKALPLGHTSTRERQAEIALKFSYGILKVVNSRPVSLTVNELNQKKLNKKFSSYSGEKHIVLQNDHIAPKRAYDLGNIQICAFENRQDYVQKYQAAGKKLSNMRVQLFSDNTIIPSYIHKKPLKSLENKSTVLSKTSDSKITALVGDKPKKTSIWKKIISHIK